MNFKVFFICLMFSISSGIFADWVPDLYEVTLDVEIELDGKKCICKKIPFLNQEAVVKFDDFEMKSRILSSNENILEFSLILQKDEKIISDLFLKVAYGKEAIIKIGDQRENIDINNFFIKVVANKKLINQVKEDYIY